MDGAAESLAAGIGGALADDRAIKECRLIVKREGGWVNDPDDPGGATKWGVTLKTARRLGVCASKRELRKLTQDKAAQIFLDEYWHKRTFKNLDGLSDASLLMSMLDQSVHSGHANAVRVLQEMLVFLGRGEVKVDGLCGNATRMAADVARSRTVARRFHMVDAYGEHRVRRYVRLARIDPKLRKYVVTRNGRKGGWIRRAEAYMTPEFRSTPDEWQRVKECLC